MNTINIDKFAVMKEMRAFHAKHPPATSEVLGSVFKKMHGEDYKPVNYLTFINDQVRNIK